MKNDEERKRETGTRRIQRNEEEREGRKSGEKGEHSSGMRSTSTIEMCSGSEHTIPKRNDTERNVAPVAI